MTRPKPTKLAAPYEHVEVEVVKSADPVSKTFEFRVETMNTKSGFGKTEMVSFSEAHAEAVLSAIRKHKAQIKREAAKNKEVEA